MVHNRQAESNNNNSFMHNLKNMYVVCMEDMFQWLVANKSKA